MKPYLIFKNGKLKTKNKTLIQYYT